MKKINKIKKISKYLVNSLNMINMLLLGLAEVWGWNIDKITASIVVLSGVISFYLTTGKLFDTKTKEEDINE